jgi:maltooligosyltrehalose trehalohydrolase
MTDSGGGAAPLGATVGTDGTQFRVWAPNADEVRLLFEEGDRQEAMTRSPEGVWDAFVAGVGAGTRYGFAVDGNGPFPDPCSRSQPHGVHGFSETVDPEAFEWDDSNWQRPPFSELVIYEVHIGTFTNEGTFDAAIDVLPHLVELGVNALEVMPVAAFPGRWNWGYDGVALFAPFSGYGGPEGFCRFVDAAHRAGIAVILDVVYNHFGPDGNYAATLAPQFMNTSRSTPWGGSINFDGLHSQMVRSFFLQHVRQMLEEYHVDGLRLDATNEIYDESRPHILAEMADLVHAESPNGRRYVIAETDENDVRYLRPANEGGYGFDAMWADDFHHVCRTVLQDDHESYYRGFPGTGAGIADTAAHGWWYRGQYDPRIERERGTQTDRVPWGSFVYCLQNHDQVGNRPFGARPTLTANEAALRAATLLLMLLPQTPMLFMGQEWNSVSTFLYFTDHHAELGEAVTEGRRAEFATFSAFRREGVRELIPDPQAEKTFLASKVDWEDARSGRGRLLFGYHRELLRLRREDPVLRAFRHERLPIEAEADGQFVTIWLRSEAGVRLIAVNLSGEKTVTVRTPESGRVVVHSDEGRFAGFGRAVAVHEGVLELPRRTAAFVELQA